MATLSRGINGYEDEQGNTVPEDKIFEVHFTGRFGFYVRVKADSLDDAEKLGQALIYEPEGREKLIGDNLYEISCALESFLERSPVQVCRNDGAGPMYESNEDGSLRVAN